MIEIALDRYEDELEDLRCFSCDGEMVYTETSNTYTYHGQKVLVHNIKCHRCLNCGEEVYSGGMVDMILHAVMYAVNKEEN